MSLIKDVLGSFCKRPGSPAAGTDGVGQQPALGTDLRRMCDSFQLIPALASPGADMHNLHVKPPRDGSLSKADEPFQMTFSNPEL